MTPSPATRRPAVARPNLDELAAAVAAHRHGRVPAELRREHILSVAHEVFVERGYEASMDELAQRAGVSKPVIYDLVGDKRQVFRVCVERASADLAERVRAAVDTSDAPEARLRAGALAFFTFVAETEPAWTALLSREGGPMADEVDEARNQQVAAVAELLADVGGTAAGAGHAGLDPVQAEALAVAVNGACESLALWWRRHPQRSAAELAELVVRLVSPGFADLFGDPPPSWAEPARRRRPG